VVPALDPGYEPWFEGWWSPPSGEIEGFLFALQAAVGAAVLGYVVGARRTRLGDGADGLARSETP
jgi:cobalt/nickel transport protein